jgi:hypothetical protein
MTPHERRDAGEDQRIREPAIAYLRSDEGGIWSALSASKEDE